MLPILEDPRLAERWNNGLISLDALLSYSAVCGTGLDTIPLPGDTSVDALARIIGDVASLSVKWNKPLSARLLPVAGKTRRRSDRIRRPQSSQRHHSASPCRRSLIRNFRSSSFAIG